MSKNLFVVVDLETTGLVAHADVVLEVGLKVVDSQLNVLHSNSWLTAPEGWQTKLAGAAPIVQEIHEKSGLTAELKSLPTFRPGEDRQYLNWSENVTSLLAYQWLTDECGLEPGKYPAMGSSVTLDRRFMIERLPVLDAFFSYRIIDVSSVKELCAVLNPDLYAVMQSMPQFDKKNAAHRVLDDIDATLNELKYYCKYFLKCSDPTFYNNTWGA